MSEEGTTLKRKHEIRALAKFVWSFWSTKRITTDFFTRTFVRPLARFVCVTSKYGAKNGSVCPLC